MLLQIVYEIAIYHPMQHLSRPWVLIIPLNKIKATAVFNELLRIYSMYNKH